MYNLVELHGALNAAMGWLDSPLHPLDAGGLNYSISDDDVWTDADQPLPEESITLDGRRACPLEECGGLWGLAAPGSDGRPASPRAWRAEVQVRPRLRCEGVQLRGGLAASAAGGQWPTDTTLIEFTDGQPVETRELDENVSLDRDANGHMARLTIEHVQQTAGMDELSYQRVPTPV